MGARQLTLLGGFQARLPDGRPVVFARKKAQALLAYPALQPDRAHPLRSSPRCFGGTYQAKGLDDVHAVAEGGPHRLGAAAVAAHPDAARPRHLQASRHLASVVTADCRGG